MSGEVGYKGTVINQVFTNTQRLQHRSAVSMSTTKEWGLLTVVSHRMS